MHDPFAMRPFFGYNAGDYMSHWLSMQNKSHVKLPKIFHVNWFRKNGDGKIMWPGFGENSRVLDWVFRRCNNEDIADLTAVGYVPKEGSINMEGLSGDIDMGEIFRLPKDFWQQEVDEIRSYFKQQMPHDLPETVASELKSLEDRVSSMS